jgi:hypothetical protein
VLVNGWIDADALAAAIERDLRRVTMTPAEARLSSVVDDLEDVIAQRAVKPPEA